MEQQLIFRNVLYNLEVFLNEQLKPLCYKDGQLKMHHFLVFSQNICANFTFEQQQYAPVMMHAVAQQLSHNLPSVKAIGIVAYANERPDDDRKFFKVILYFPIAAYTRDYVSGPKFEELGEKWFRPEEEVYGFHNPFTTTDRKIIEHIPQLDFKLTYRSISKRFKRQRLHFMKEHPESQEIMPGELPSSESDSDGGDLYS